MSPFPNLGMPGVFFYSYLIFDISFVSQQCRPWVCTVCIGLKNGTRLIWVKCKHTYTQVRTRKHARTGICVQHETQTGHAEHQGYDRNMINPYKTNGPFHPHQLDECISKFMGVWLIFLF